MFFWELLNNSEKEKLQQRTAFYANFVKKDIPSLPVFGTFTRREIEQFSKRPGREIQHYLYTATAELWITACSKHSTALVFHSILARKKTSKGNQFSKVLIPVDFRNSSKDSALWGSYLGRFCNAEIKLLVASEKNTEDRALVASNTESISRLFTQFSFPWSSDFGKSSSWGIHKEAVKNEEPSMYNFFQEA
jgi:hypothetical protein